MRSRLLIWILAASMSTIASSASAQPYVYPAKGQSKEQQDRDQYECYQWAKQQTGFDPSAPPQGGAPRRGGEVVGGGARGAAGGAVGGGGRGKAGEGRGDRRRRRSRRGSHPPPPERKGTAAAVRRQPQRLRSGLRRLHERPRILGQVDRGRSQLSASRTRSPLRMVNAPASPFTIAG